MPSDPTTPQSPKDETALKAAEEIMLIPDVQFSKIAETRLTIAQIITRHFAAQQEEVKRVMEKVKEAVEESRQITSGFGASHSINCKCFMCEALSLLTRWLEEHE